MQPTPEPTQDQIEDYYDRAIAGEDWAQANAWVEWVIRRPHLVRPERFILRWPDTGVPLDPGVAARIERREVW